MTIFTFENDGFWGFFADPVQILVKFALGKFTHFWGICTLLGPGPGLGPGEVLEGSSKVQFCPLVTNWLPEGGEGLFESIRWLSK